VFHKKDVKSFMEYFPYKDSSIPACIASSITNNNVMETKSKVPCKYCEAGHNDDAGGYYAEKRCKQAWCIAQLKVETDPAKRKQLLREYEMACYVGD
jgi:hypothetical protein